jgi:hypothetical protein
MTGGGIGHPFCWERHERDGTWYAWVSWVQSTSDPVRHRHHMAIVGADGVRRLESPEAYRNVPRRTLYLPKSHPCRLSGMPVLVGGCRRGGPSADVKAGAGAGLGDWRGQRLQWPAVRDSLVRPMGVVELRLGVLRQAGVPHLAAVARADNRVHVYLTAASTTARPGRAATGRTRLPYVAHQLKRWFEVALGPALQWP